MVLLLSLLLSLSNINLEISVAKGDRDEIPSEFQPIETIEYLDIRTPYWAKIEFELDEKGQFVLQGGKPNMNRISFYNDEGILIKEGNHLQIDLSKEGKKTYYLFYPFVDEKDKNLLSIELHTLSNFIVSRNKERSQQLIFQSLLLFPCMVAFFFAVFTKKKVYAFYALYILSLMFFFGYQYGIIGNVLDFFNDIPPMWVWFFGFLMTYFYLLFSSSFLDLKEHDPFSLRLINIAIYFILFFFLVSVILYLFNIDVQHSIAYKAPFLLIEIFLVTWFIVRIFKHPYKIKYYYLTGFFILITVSLSGQILSVNQSAADYNHIFQAGLVVEVFILALGLGARVNEIQKAEIRTQNALIDQLQINEQMKDKYAAQLEQQVYQRTQDLTRRNKEVEFLLKEVHHRVKNNLQMITSMLNMHHRRTNSAETDVVFKTTKTKIKSLAMIHEFLYSSEDLSSISLNRYLPDLCEMIIDSLHSGNNIDLQIDIEEVATGIETGISLGLIVNELVTNSLKYGIAKVENPMLRLELVKSDAVIHLKLTDNGRGIKGDKIEYGLGYTIIESILANNDGELRMLPISTGFSVAISMRDN
jgi:two-component sensor histidine kinase